MAPTAHNNPLKILILGDVSVDTLIVPVSDTDAGPEIEAKTREKQDNCWRHRRAGGVWLLKHIMDAAFASLKEEILEHPVDTYEKPELPEDEIVGANDVKTVEKPATDIDRDFLNSSILLGLFPKDPKKKETDQEQVYRIKTALGWVHNKMNPFTDEAIKIYEETARTCLKTYQPKDDTCNLLVLHDTNGYFRALEDALEEALGKLISDKTWIVWQMYSPLARGTLWEIFKKRKNKWLDRTVAVVKGEAVRHAGANLSPEISLEQESQNFVTSIKNVKSLRDLASNVRHLVVHLHHEGVMHYDRDKGLRTSCYFCPNLWHETDLQKYGFMRGYTSIMVAAVARAIAWSMHHVRDPERVDEAMAKGIIEGIQQGVVLDHLYFLDGYANKDDFIPVDKPEALEASATEAGGNPEASQKPGAAAESEAAANPKPAVKPKVPNPYARIFKALDSAKWDEGNWKKYRIAATPLPEDPDKLADWSRIEGFIDVLRHADTGPAISKSGRSQAEKVALEIVQKGLAKATEEKKVPPTKAAQATDKDPPTPGTPTHTLLCPFEKHGKIQTAYRQEIDSFASIRRIMKKYVDHEEWKDPLSIAVFGPPGSGKGFTIKQILENVNPPSPSGPWSTTLPSSTRSEIWRRRSTRPRTAPWQRKWPSCSSMSSIPISMASD